MYLVDSDVIIDLLRGVKGSKEFLLGLFRSRAFISVLTKQNRFLRENIS